MSKRCPSCGASNEDSRIFCSACGDPLNADLRLIKDLEKQKTAAPVTEKADPEPEIKPTRPKTDDGDYDLGKLSKEEKSSPLPWIILGVIVAAAVVIAVCVL